VDEEDDPNINNPLSLDASSPWSKYFENEQLRKTILQDVERTYPEYTYFQQQWVKDMMMGILFIYSKENPEVSYKQGMHELLAPVIYTLDHEKIVSENGSVLSQLMDKNRIEDDAYIIFERLMKTTGCWFLSHPTTSKEKKNGHATVESPILVKCYHIYNNLLKAKDPGLYSYITSLKIEPQLFLLRWIRLLFGREFRLSETLVLWDAIFAYDKAFTLIDYVAVSMLMTIREQLLSADQNGVLQLLFKYPTLVTIPTFVDHALIMAKAKKRHVVMPPQTPSPAAGGTNPMVRNTPAVGQARSLSVGLGKVSAISGHGHQHGHQHGHHGHQHAGLPSTAEREVVQLKWLHNNVATRLENIVGILQTNLLPEANKNQVPDTVLLAVAELKQIKDVMCGHLPLEALPPIQPDPTNKTYK